MGFSALALEHDFVRAWVKNLRNLKSKRGGWREPLAAAHTSRFISMLPKLLTL